MARDLDLLPRVELAVGLAQQLVGLGLQLAHFLGDVHIAGVVQVAQFFDLAFELGDRFFEIEKSRHDGFRDGSTGRCQEFHLAPEARTKKYHAPAARG